jgi:hypothetical protein
MLVRSSLASRPEEAGEVRLLAWVAKPREGQTIDPPVDLHQGFTLVVAHLKVGAPPDPASLAYNTLAAGPERPAPALLNTPIPQVPPQGMFFPRRRGGAPAAAATMLPGGLPKGAIITPKAAMPVAPMPGPRPGAAPGAPGQPDDDPMPDGPDQPEPPGAPQR